MLTPVPNPFTDKDGNLKDAPLLWLGKLRKLINTTAAAVATVSLANHGAAILTTTAYTPTLAGVFRVSYFLIITTAAGVSSAAQITIGFMTGTVAQTKVGANVNGNTTTSYDQGVVFIRSDAGKPITYAVSYASNLAGVMKFRLELAIEQVTG